MIANINNSEINIEGAIFDLDGTLIDSMKIWHDVSLIYMRLNGIEPPEDFQKKFLKLSIVQAATLFNENYFPNIPVEEIIKQINALVEDFYFNEALPKKGVKDVLQYFKENNVKMCIATATDRYLVEKCLERNNLLEYFSEIFTCTEVGSGKDTPVIYTKALKQLNTPKENTYIFEDAFYAIRTAKAAEFNVIAIEDEYETRKDKAKKRADYYLHNWSEIIKNPR